MTEALPTNLLSLYDVYQQTVDQRPADWTERDWLVFIYKHEQDVHILEENGRVRGMLIAHVSDKDTVHITAIVGDLYAMSAFIDRFEPTHGHCKWMTYRRRGRNVRVNYQRLKQIIWTNAKMH